MNELQKPEVKPPSIRSYMQSDAVKKQIAMVLPKHLTADVMARVVCTAILKTPKLADCKIESLLQSVMLLSQFGLLPDGRNAHLIPYGNICQAIIDYKGYIARASDNGLKNIIYDIACMNDKFKWKRNSSGLDFEHELDFHNPERGAMFAAYCTWTNDKGQFEGEIMTKAEIDSIKNRSRASSSGPWVTDYNEMAKKTVVRRASKRWPLDAKFKEALDTGALKSAATVEVELDTPEVASLPPVQDESPAASLPQAAQEKPAESQPETAKQFLARMMDENGITFDQLTAFCTANNICQNADSMAGIDEIPIAVVEVLIQPAKMTKIIKTYKATKA